MFATTLRGTKRLCLFAAFFAFGLSVPVQAGNLPNRNFWVGYNEAWFNDANYGNWLSSNPTYPGFAVSQFSATLGVLDRYFGAMERGNAKIVRIWLFPALQGIVRIPNNLGVPETRGLTPEFLGNLEVLLARARAHRLKVYITLLNGVDMYQAVLDNAEPGADHQFLEKLISYYGSLLLDKNNELTAFKQTVLSPLLQRLNNFRDVIYAIDLMNEIEGPAGVGYFPEIPKDPRNWIRDMAAFVKANSPQIPVTSSAGFGVGVEEIATGLYSGLGLDFYDVHIYADYGRYSGQAELCRAVRNEGRQIILGEYGQSAERRDDILQSVTTASFLFGALRSCFSSALAWKFEATMGKTWFSYVRQTNQYGMLAFRPAYYTVAAFGALSFK